MNDFFDLPTLIFLAIAIFVLLRLRSVLGTRTGNEKPASKRIVDTDKKAKKPIANNDDNIVTLHPENDPSEADIFTQKRMLKLDAQIEKFTNGDKKLAQGLKDIAKLDDGFMPKDFLEGAKSAYEMIVTSFALGDKKTLKNLLAKDVYDGFVSAISQREADGYKVDFTFVGLPKVEFGGAEIEKRTSLITINFLAEVVSATRDSEGNLVEGNADQIASIADSWTFARNTASNDPNWKLVTTDQLD